MRIKDLAIPPVPRVDYYPTLDYLLVLEIRPGKTAGGIELPPRDRDSEVVEPTVGLVVAAGPGRICEVDAKTRWPMSCSVGDVIYFGGGVGVQVEMPIDGKMYLRIRDRDVCGHALPPKKQAG